MWCENLVSLKKWKLIIVNNRLLQEFYDTEKSLVPSHYFKDFPQWLAGSFLSRWWKWASIILHNTSPSFALPSSTLTSSHFMSFVPVLLLHCSVLPPSSSSEPLEEHHVAQLLRCFSTDHSLGRHLSLDGAQAHHLHQCSYHLRLFRNWLISGQDPLEYLHGQPPWPHPSMPPASRPVQPLV